MANIPAMSGHSYERLERRREIMIAAQGGIYDREGETGYNRVEEQILEIEDEIFVRFPDTRLAKEMTADRELEQQQKLAPKTQKEVPEMQYFFEISY